MKRAVRKTAEIVLRGLVLSGLVALTSALINPVTAGGEECEEDCDCINEYFWCGPCSEIPGGASTGDCLFNRCATSGPNEGSCIFNWEDCEEHPPPQWVEECEIS